MMEGEDDMGIDPAIAAAMGFSGFGSQPKDKRKFNTNDTFVDPSVSTQSNPAPGHVSTGANAVQVSTTSRDVDMVRGETAAADTKEAVKNLSEATLEDLKKGVRNENGDIVYFMPSFIEDPWKDLPAK